MLVLLAVVNTNKKSKSYPVKHFLIKISPDDDHIFFRLKNINGTGLYYELDSEETRFYGNPTDAQLHNLMWFSALCDSYDGKWEDITANLKNHLGALEFNEVSGEFRPQSLTSCFTVIIEFRN